MRIALAGNPNSGKTTLYNELTGAAEKIGTGAGVTVSEVSKPMKKSLLPNDADCTVIDLPGAYSMSPYTNDESITSKHILEKNPDVLVNVLDATNISRGLFLTTQLLELNIPVVVYLNKSDLAAKGNIVIDAKMLSKELSCPVLEGSANKTTEAELKTVVESACSAAAKSESKGEAKEVEFGGDDQKRFENVGVLVKKVETRQVSSTELSMGDKVDKVIAHKWLGIPIFAVVMYLVFQISQVWVGTPIADFLVGYIEMFQEWAGSMLGEDVSPLLYAILIDGVIGGVGAVVGFLPLIMILFFLIALLEDCGYMSRVAVVLDRFFKKIGLSGKSIIPLIIGTGCAIPGVMASRAIKNDRERRTTAMVTPFIPCGAKLPVIALFAGVFFPDQTWVTFAMYVIGVVLVIVGSLVVKQVVGFKNRKSFFVMDMPQYKLPSLLNALKVMCKRGWAFIVKAATIILLCNMAIQVMQSFDLSFNLVEEGAENSSILATIASPIAFLLVPLGFGTWQLAAASVTGLIAKENIVGTLAVVFSITSFIDTDALEMTGGASEIAFAMGLTQAGAMAFLAFNLYNPPCFAAIGAMNAEMENKKWLWGGIAMQFGVAYVVAFCVYHGMTLAATGSTGTAFLPGLIAVAVIVAIVVCFMVRGGRKAAKVA